VPIAEDAGVFVVFLERALLELDLGRSLLGAVDVLLKDGRPGADHQRDRRAGEDHVEELEA